METEVLRGIVEQAARAPSIHNTQPWRFVSRDSTIELWTDPSRGLAVLDPGGRARHISCGAALLQARLAAAAAGHQTTVTLLPEADNPTHLADIHVEDSPPADTDRRLAAAIGSRHTDRDAFHDQEFPDEVMRELRLAAESEGCWLRVVDSPADTAAVAVLMARADEVEAADPAYRDELRRWTQRGEDAVEGVPSSAVPATDPRRRGSNYRLRDFVADRDSTSRADAADDEPPAVERPLVVVLGTPDDDISAWVMAGQALGRLLLTATSHGLSASPLTQALEIPDTRARLAADLGVVGRPQMLVRIGYGHGGAPTPRRPVADILTEGEARS